MYEQTEINIQWWIYLLDFSVPVLWFARNPMIIQDRTGSTGNTAYLHVPRLIHDYLPVRTLPSSDKLLLAVPRMALALSAKAFSVSAPSVWNSLSYNCRSAELVTIFKRGLKTELFHIAYSKVNTQPSLCHYAPLIRSRHIAPCKCFDWLMRRHYLNVVWTGLQRASILAMTRSQIKRRSSSWVSPSKGIDESFTWTQSLHVPLTPQMTQMPAAQTDYHRVWLLLYYKRSVGKCGCCGGGVEILAFPLTMHIVYTTACCYHTSRDY